MIFTPGEMVGPYRIMEQLGQGGMATVYKAYHAGLDRYVAIKVLHPGLTEDLTFTARFQREARVVAKLDHPNIVPVHDYNDHRGHPYLVMKFIEGETLKQRLSRGPLTSREINAVVDLVGSALAYAHQQGVLHRDIKPSNVLLADDGHIYLADFGLARIAQSSEASLTSDAVIGTPQYISPEQAVGKKDLDQGTDIYSFGVMLYEMVVGRVPFSGDTPFSVIFDHIYTPLPLPRFINPSVPESVELVLIKALAKESADRYATVSEMVEAFKSAWNTAGVPMQGTAIILPSRLPESVLPVQPDLPAPSAPEETGSAPASTGPVVSEIPEKLETLEKSGTPEKPPAPPAEIRRPVKKAVPPGKLFRRRPFWLYLAGAGALLVCCLAALGVTGLLNRYVKFRDSLGLGPTQTSTPVPTEFTFCTGEQTWINRDYFPEREIEHCWGRGHYITGLTYTGSEWMVIMTREVSYTDQAYLTDSAFPETQIQSYRDRGFYITDVYYGGGQWTVVLSKGAGFTDQRYLVSDGFPDEQVRNYWEQAGWITSLGYGGGHWVVVISSGAPVNDQVYFLRTAFPKDEIDRYWDADYYITQVLYANSVWAFVMSKGDLYSNQYYYNRGTFPSDGIEEDWGNDFFITGLTYGDSLWVVTLSKP